MKQSLNPQHSAPLPIRRTGLSRVVPLLLLLLVLSPALPVAAQEEAGPSPVISVGEDSVKVQLPEIEMEVGLVLVRGGREIEGYVPLVVSIFNRGHDLVRVRKDEFHLYGEKGEELPLATVKQVRSGYRLYRQDSEILKRSSFLSSLSGDYRQTNFFPTPGTVGIYAMTLDNREFFIDFLYFVGNWNQRLRLVAEGNKSRPVLDVQFRIPPPGGQNSDSSR